MADSTISGLATALTGAGTAADDLLPIWDTSTASTKKQRVDELAIAIIANATAASLLAKILTVDGAGSGLDADLLDGNSAAAFALASHTHAVADLSDASANGRSLISAANYAAMKTLLDLEIGVDVQAYDADLTTWAGLTPSANAQSLVTAANYAAMRALLDLEVGTDFPALVHTHVQADVTGLTTADSPQFAGVNVGHASDTTVTRSAAGEIAVEGKRIFNDGDRSAIGCVIDGGGATITTGIKGDIGPFTFACTIEDVTLLADQSGSIVIDIWKDSYANYPPTDADTITASAPPTISAATKSQDTTLTGWTTSIAVGDILRFNVDSITTCQRVALTMKIKRT